MEELDPIFPHAFAHHHILAGLTAYYIVEGLLKLLCRHYKPDFYARLKSNDRFLPFFGFCMGWIITLLSTPVCFHAFLTEKYALNTYHISASGQICLASRSILWVSELNRLEYTPYYIKHHLLSLSHLIFHLYARLPLAPLYLIYASLMTELLSTALALLAIAGYKTSERTASRLHIARAGSLVAIRMPPIVYGLWRHEGENPGVGLCGWRWVSLVAAAGLYWLSLVHLVINQTKMMTKKKKKKQKNKTEKLPAGALPAAAVVRFLREAVRAYRYALGRLNPFGILAAAAYLAMILSTWTVYALVAGGETQEAPAPAPPHHVIGLLCQAALAGCLGARLPSLIIMLLLLPLLPGSSKQRSQENNKNKNKKKTEKEEEEEEKEEEEKKKTKGLEESSPRRLGYWFQSGAVCAAVWVVSSPLSVLDAHERGLLLAAGVVSLPLGEALGRVGCHFGHCCGSTYQLEMAENNRNNNKKRYKTSVPLVVSLLCLLNYCLVVSAWLYQRGLGWNIYQAAAASVALQGAGRLLAERWRRDIPWLCAVGRQQYTVTSLFACAQVVIGAAALAYLLVLHPERKLEENLTSRPGVGPMVVPSTSQWLPTSVIAILSLPVVVTQAWGSDHAGTAVGISAAVTAVLA